MASPSDIRRDADLVLRPYRAADAEALLAAVTESMDSVGRWLSWCSGGYSIDDAREFATTAEQAWHAGDGPLDMAIEHAGELAGSLRLRLVDPTVRVGNLGYWLRYSLQGRGLMRRAAALALSVAFEDMHMARLEIVTACENRRSRRLAESLGAQFEGVARQRVLDRGRPADAAVYAVLADDPRPL